MLLLYSPFKFRVLPIPDSDYKHHGGQGLRNGTPGFGLDLEAQLCVNTPQTFTIDGSSMGEPPETVAVVTPDGENVIETMCCLFCWVFHTVLNSKI